MSFIPRNEWANQAQWLVTPPLLFASLYGVAGALESVLALCAISIVAYGVTQRTIWSYRIQVRIGFMGLIALGTVPHLVWVLWIPAFGTAAQSLFGYCLMARVLDLMPWNRTEAASLRDVFAVIVRPPGREGLLSSIFQAGEEVRYETPDEGGAEYVV